MSTGLEQYDEWKQTAPPPQHPDPADPHEGCERDVARLETEVEAAKHVAAKALSFAELHALVGRLVGDCTYAVSVDVWRHHPGRIAATWAVCWFPDNKDHDNCLRLQGASALEVYTKLRAELLRKQPADEVGDIPW